MAGLHDLEFPEANHEESDYGGQKHSENQCQPTLGDFLVVNSPRWQLNSRGGSY